jgi:uncharacterized protein (DUF433 family)
MVTVGAGDAVVSSKDGSGTHVTQAGGMARRTEASAAQVVRVRGGLLGRPKRSGATPAAALGTKAQQPVSCSVHRGHGCKLVQSMATTDRIEIDPNIMLGKPVIRGSRIPVELVLRKLAEGATEADLLDAYPRLTRDDVRAAIAYGADAVSLEEAILVTPQAPPNKP